MKSSLDYLRIIKYFNINFFLMFKSLTEYKANYISAIVSELFYMSTIFIFFSIIVTNFLEVINWTIGDFVLYFCLYSIIMTTASLFLWKESLYKVLSSGDLNLNLVRPINQMLFYLGSKLSPVAIIMCVIYVIFSIITIFYFDLMITNIMFGMIISILIILLFIFYYSFISSLDFYLLGLSKTFSNPIDSIRKTTMHYPEPFFKKSKLKVLLILIIPMFFVGSLLLPVIRNYPVWNFKFQLITLVLLVFLFMLGTIINWHYGLKKYEAFG